MCEYANLPVGRGKIDWKCRQACGKEGRQRVDKGRRERGCVCERNRVKEKKRYRRRDIMRKSRNKTKKMSGTTEVNQKRPLLSPHLSFSLILFLFCSKSLSSAFYSDSQFDTYLLCL